MPSVQNENETLVDYITGQTVFNTGAEANRQQIERFLVETKGYAKTQIEVDAPIEMEIDGESYRSCVDLVVSVKGRRYIVIKCAPGSLASREREVVAAARLLDTYQVPLAIASDGRTAIIWDTVSGDKLGAGIEAIPCLREAEKVFDPHALLPLAEMRRSRQQLIFRSYDSMNVNRRMG